MKAIANLCALKRTTEFSKIQLSVWYGGLQVFPAWIVNIAVLKVGMSVDRFTEFGDVYQVCRAEAIKAGLITERYSGQGPSNEKGSVGTEEVLKLGDALGLVVRNKV